MVYNFGAGPAMLPPEVMQQAKEEFIDYKGTGISIMETSHRSDIFQEVLDSSFRLFRELLEIPKEFSIGFFSGGATLHFSAMPLNVIPQGKTADFALTGVWAIKAFEEAQKWFPVKAITDAKESKYRSIPELKEELLSPASKYVHITSNNTIYGTQYANMPTISKPLVCDMTSDILSRKIDWKKMGAVFAGAQKNIGPSGLSVLIIRNDFLEESKTIPILLDYKTILKNGSLYNTPPTYSIYISKLVLEWLQKKGGIAAQEKENLEKSKLLYEYIDSSNLFYAPVEKNSRSVMNVVFLLKNESLNAKLEAESEKAGFVGLAGHRLAGGFRASLYNPMPIQGVQELIRFLKEFERANG